MTDTAAAQLRRILALVPELADGEEHAIDQLAAALATDRETLLGDIWSLTERFDPGGFVNEGIVVTLDDDERVCLASNHFRRPMRLVASELHALDLGLAMLEGERAVEDRPTIRRARARLATAATRLARATAGDAPSLRVAESADAGDGVYLAAAREAVRARRKLRLRYRRGDREAATDRVVAPYGLVVASGMWYVVAYCEDRSGIRVFRLDRIEGAELLDETFLAEGAFALDSVVREGRVLHADAPTTMTVRYSPRIARWIAEREGKALDADGGLTMEHPLLDVAWGVRHVLQYGVDAEVVGPEVVRRAVADRLAAVLADGQHA